MIRHSIEIRAMYCQLPQLGSAGVWVDERLTGYRNLLEIYRSIAGGAGEV